MILLLKNVEKFSNVTNRFIHYLISSIPYFIINYCSHNYLVFENKVSNNLPQHSFR